MEYQPIRDVYYCRLEALTPVHVGSGETLKRHFDFFILRGRIHLVSQTRLFSEVEQLGPEKIDEFTKAIAKRGAGAWIEKQGIPVDRISMESFSLPAGNYPNEIRAHIRDSFGRPYIPGSSIKGAFRTAIIRRLARENKTPIRDGSGNSKIADQKVCKALLGQDAKVNLMRALTVSDFGVEGLEALSHNKALVYRQEKAGSGAMDSMKIGKPKHKRQMEISIEHMPSGTVCSGSISLDRYLVEKDRERSCFEFKAHLDLVWLITACRKLAQHTIKTELEFLEDKTGVPVEGIKGFYKDLQEKQKDLKENEVFFQMAWGAGWRGMTGQLLEIDDLTPETRKKLNLAPKYLDFPFPKSRRIVTVNGRSRPIGWVKMAFLSREELRQRAEREEQDAIIRQQKAERQQAEAAALDAAQDLENFQARVKECKNLPGEIENFIRQVRARNDRQIRVKMCRALVDKGASLGKKNKFSKALRNGKKWALGLRNLCDENDVDL
ncbi:MAG: type III-A CRISPR-associated RAMP protein Csm5 [Deltaproteobacteria bacterium]|nr:type III-A CRISPR-associated RAMP protein Csm5 [Deltaproteobacteria bacterium]